MTDPTHSRGTDDPSTTSAEPEQPRRRSYGQVRRDRIDELAAGSVDDQPGVSLIRSAWRRLRRAGGALRAVAPVRVGGSGDRAAGALRGVMDVTQAGDADPAADRLQVKDEVGAVAAVGIP